MSANIANNASSRLAVSIDTDDTSISVLAGDGAKFPALGTAGDWFPVTLVKATGELEICKCTARAGDLLTVERAQEGTSPKSFNVNDRVELRMTKATFDSRLDEKFDKTGGAISGDVSIDGALSVTGTIEFADIAASGDIDVGGNATVAGTSTLTGDVTMGGDLSVTGDTTINGDVSINKRVVMKKSSAIASATTVDLTTATGPVAHITGTTQIEAWTMLIGQMMDLIFDATMVLKHSTANNNLPGLADIETNPGDRARFYYDGETVYCLSYQRVDGTSVQDVPVGMQAYFLSSAPPQGWLKANGAAVSRTSYAALFAVIGTTYGAGDGTTTFNLPDLRSEFIRGWDDGRNVDTGRTLGSWQNFAIQSHQHSYTGPLGSNGYTNTTNGGFSRTSGQTGLTGGTETRPRNYALLACIKV